ncbi:hypothetical protein DUNSADRAFT_14221 [Dunaliella salina]|uniref:Uncharacterized protein n=1 Tax=Dunaliella salina TaxID=3046 RepID=A0ABQ7G7S4_DUNSA|nr:hypothetical protein DUNSADRAFT_14221 [Dunaliella salina]|eukprot:KAF5830656.1 hypothetical protein DUNSADRAFT_14221 [Dunaliella salina]
MSSMVCRSMKKFYLHLCDQHGSHTKVIRLDENDLRTLHECAINAFPHVKGQALQAYTLVHEERKKPLSLDVRTSKLKHLEDVLLEPLLQQASSPSSGASAAPTTTAAADPAALRPLLACATSAVQAKNFQLAAELYGQVLSFSPGHSEALEALGCVWLKHARQPARAQPYLEQLANSQPKSSASGSRAHELLGDCLLALGAAPKALQAYNRALSAAMDVGAELSRQQDLQIAVARAMHAQVDQPVMQDLASQLVMNVLGANEMHFGGLELYATIAEEQGLYEDALRVALRLVIVQRHHPTLRALLARRLQAPGGLQALYAELSLEGNAHGDSASGGKAPSRTGTASALAFLASVVKDHGAVAPVVALLQKALEYDPLHPGYALSLAHALELSHDLAGVVASVAAYLRRVETAGPSQASHLTLGGGLQWKDVVNLLEGLPPRDARNPCSWLAWRSMEPWDPHAFQGAPTGQACGGKVAYSHEQLDMLALCCTAVKALYVGGAVTRAARLVAVIEPARQASKHELHTTLIRNEAAYYNCVRQLLCDAPPPSYGADASDAAASRRNSDSTCPRCESPSVTSMCKKDLECDVRSTSASLARLQVGVSDPGQTEQTGTTVPSGPSHGLSVGQEECGGSSCSSMPCSAAGNMGAGSHEPSDRASSLHISQDNSDSSTPCPAISGTASDRAPGAVQQGAQRGDSASCMGAAPGVRASDAGHESWPAQGPNAPEPLFLCGDSHCLPAAWRIVTLRGKPRLLLPLLVTGCKIWHLRPQSSFYPKIQFHNALAYIPDGSQVVVLLGEIDCREGLLMAVQKCKYSSLREAIAAIVDLYVSILTDLMKHRKFKIFVHPIPPVLNETRSLVKAFMQLLKCKVPAASSSLGEFENGGGHLRYLDFFECLLSPDGSTLAQGLALDGTHLSPAYLPHFASAFW